MIVVNCNARIDAQGQELRQHGTALLPAACYHDLLAQYPVPWHWHDELEAGVVRTGKILLSVGGQHLTVPAGDGFFINSGVLHSAVMAGEENAERIPQSRRRDRTARIPPAEFPASQKAHQ